MKILLSRPTPQEHTIKKQRHTNLPSQIEPVKLQKNLYHHGHAAMNKNKMIFTAAGFTAPCALPGSLLLSRQWHCQHPGTSFPAVGNRQTRWLSEQDPESSLLPTSQVLPRCTDITLTSAILSTHESINQVLRFHKGATDLNIVG